MISPSNLLSLALLYVCVLFAVAWYADRKSNTAVNKSKSAWHSIVYALSLAVYCSSWTFYGAVGSATESAWSHAPIYLGPILLFVFGWPLIRRLLAIGARHRVTSIADFIGARYGKRQSLAVLVTLVASAAVLPYIALQFKALAQTWTIVGGSVVEVEAIGGDTAMLSAIILAVFTILFGTRRLDGRERHQGVMAAIAVESVVKLLAFGAVAVLAILYLIEAPSTAESEHASVALGEFSLSADFVARTLISALAILCLPRQFHVMVVEAQEGDDTRIARWVFPLYLLLFMLLVVPLSLAGAQIFAVADNVNPDTYVQLLPIALEANWIVIAAFIGGISAATGMVIVATVSLAIMISNEVVLPIIMRFNADSPEAILKMGDSLRRIRQFTIAGILLAAWLVARMVMGIPWLAQIGFISFLAAAQLAPAVIAGIYWRRAHGVAVTVGLLLGLALWFYCAVLPVTLSADNTLLVTGPAGISWLRPMSLFGIDGEHRLAYATTWSLGLNVFAMIALSLVLKPSQADRRQARLFTDEYGMAERFDEDNYELSLIRVSYLQALLPPFIDARELRQTWRQFEDSYQQRLLPGDRAPMFVVTQVESLLASVIGATSAHKVMQQLESSQQLAYSDFAEMVGDASRLQTFNRELLQTTVESLLQGVAVVDGDLRLVAWNSRYQEMFDYPQRFLYVGCPIERVYRFNAERGIVGSRDGYVADEIEKRLQLLREGSPYRLERTLPNGTVIDIRGNPMPHGGFVATYIDITEYREMFEQLQEAKIELEAKVASDSETLSNTNAQLRQENRLRAQVEASLRDAHLSKTRFMSATSHDLLQPINAARLFTAALKPQLTQTERESTGQIVDQIEASLTRAEQLISELREISRLDSGVQKPQTSSVSAQKMFAALGAEFSPEAALKGLKLNTVNSSIWLHSDPSLLFRIIQNLLSNAIKYTREGTVLLGLRRRSEGAEIQVWDTGPGIAEEDQMRIFQEFERLPGSHRGSEEGLGLGLSIVQRYADLLGHRVELRSVQGQGTRFSVIVPYGETGTEATVLDEVQSSDDLSGIHILCLDNDVAILEGMQHLLQGMGARVAIAEDGQALLEQVGLDPLPDIILADYHLDAGETGMDAVLAARAAIGVAIPTVMISADDSEALRAKAKAAGFRFLAKPVNPLRLRALIIALVPARN